MPASDGSALINAVRHSNLDRVRSLLNNGEDVNARDADGNTALHYVKDPDCARLLLERQADPKLANLGGNTPLHLASWTANDPEIIDVLVSFGANVNAKNGIGETPLHRACAREPNGNLPFLIITKLIGYGADLDIGDLYGNTSLHTSKIAYKKFLVEKGANPARTNRHGDPALTKSAMKLLGLTALVPVQRGIIEVIANFFFNRSGNGSGTGTLPASAGASVYQSPQPGVPVPSVTSASPEAPRRAPVPTGLTHQRGNI
jgi:ankyrin repeat protein